MQNEEFIVISFSSSHHAMAAEAAACEIDDLNGIRLIPIMPEISAGCGFVLKIKPEQKEVVIKLLTENGIEFSKIFLVRKENGIKTFSQII